LSKIQPVFRFICSGRPCNRWRISEKAPRRYIHGQGIRGVRFGKKNLSAFGKRRAADSAMQETVLQTNAEPEPLQTRALDFLKLIGRRLAGAAVLGDLVAYFLAFAQIT
jgi:hypothetical protein